MLTTTRDIAARLNLSVSTVGRALADDPRISSETKLRVYQMAGELGYVANRAARMMRGARSTVIGLVVPDVRNSFYSTVAHALAETMSFHGHQVMLCETADRPENELQQVRDLAAAQVAGVVIVPTARPDYEVSRLLRAIPHVQLLRKVPSLSQDWFGIDDEKVIHTATTHLLNLGHRRIAYVGGTVDVSTAAARCAGFCAALAESGMRPDARNIEVGSPSAASHGGDALRRLMAGPKPPTAIVTGSIQITRGVLDAIHRDSILVPDQLSVVGFGDEPGFSWWGPGLTTVSLPVHDIVTACGIWLLHRLATGDPDSGHSAHYASVSPGLLLERGSTAQPAKTTGRKRQSSSRVS